MLVLDFMEPGEEWNWWSSKRQCGMDDASLKIWKDSAQDRHPSRTTVESMGLSFIIV